LGCQDNDCQGYLLVVKYLVGLEKFFKPSSYFLPEGAVLLPQTGVGGGNFLAGADPELEAPALPLPIAAPKGQFGMLHFFVLPFVAKYLVSSRVHFHAQNHWHVHLASTGGGKERLSDQGHRRRNMYTPFG